MEMLGARELAEMFDLVAKMCALDEKLSGTRNSPVELRCSSHLGDELRPALNLAGASA